MKPKTRVVPQKLNTRILGILPPLRLESETQALKHK